MSKRVSPYFDKIEFPDYEYREYPKMLYASGGRSTTVVSAEEEAALEGDWFKTPGEAKKSTLTIG